jgi:hypothetical protein
MVGHEISAETIAGRPRLERHPYALDRSERAAASPRHGQGPVGPGVLYGSSADSRFTATFAPGDATDNGFAGTLLPENIAGDKLDGTMRVSLVGRTPPSARSRFFTRKVGFHVFPASRYLPWAIRFYGQVPFDLATSGTPISETSGSAIPA